MNRYTQKDLDSRDQAWEQSLADLQQHQNGLEVQNAELKAEVASLRVDVERARVSSAREASAQIDEALAELERAMRSMSIFATGDVEYVEGPDGPMLRIKDRILFPSGSRNVTTEGRGILARLGTELARLNRPIRVVGHTDAVPVRVTAKDFPRGNLELSSARAVEVAALLVEAGFPADRVSVGAFGQHQPLDSNESASGRAKNRRVEIVILPPRP